MHRLLHFLGLSGWLVLGGCVDRYTPDVLAAAQTSLVVDGFINPQGSTVITLSRTFSVNTKNTAPAEAKARIVIQDETGTRYPLTENPAGSYSSAALVLSPARQYQLRITTAQGREYASDIVPVLTTPPIDTLTWRLQNDGVQIYLTTHDASTAARYYRWDYDETYQFTSAFESSIEYVPSRNGLRPRRTSIFRCWRTEPSTAILQSNTTQLSQNTLASYPLLSVPPSAKLRLGYSLLVRQYAQTPAEYDYWERLRKDTENLGTVNDPLPSRVTGNVHAVADPAEAVLGFVGVHTVTEKRLFIDATTQLPKPQPRSVFYDPAYAACGQTEKLLLALALPAFKAGLRTPAQPVIDTFSGDTIGATVGSPGCVDCTLRGTNVKPSFWP